MGCDIHVRCEYLNKNGEWIDCDYYKRNQFFDENEREEVQFEKKLCVVPVYDMRDYDLYAILANVRNYSGAEYISNPKGVPDDCNKYIKKDIEEWGVDGHSHSYLTLRELVEWQNKHTKVAQKGLISPKEAKKLDEEGVLPSMWCQGTSDKTWVWRKWYREKKPLDPIIKEMKNRLADFGWLFTEEQINENMDKIRIVFWFDN